MYTKLPKCNSCGGDFNENITCNFCGHKGHEIFEIIKPENNIERYFIKLYDRILNGTSTKLDEKHLLYFMHNDMIENVEAVTQNIIMDRITIQKTKISYDTFEKIINYYVIWSMKELNSIIKQKYKTKYKNFIFSCEIVELNETTQGLCSMDNMGNNKNFYNTKMKINKNDVLNLFENGNISSLLTFFHELRHVQQDIFIKNNIFNNNIMLQIKEQIIRKYEISKYKTNTFYNNNYYNLVMEYDAELVARDNLINLFSFFELPIPQETMQNYKNFQENVPDFRIKKIIVNNKEIISTLGDVFETIIQEVPEYLELYPQLKVEYINDNGTIRRKTIQELEESLSDFENDANQKEKTIFVTELIDILKQNNKITI